MSDDGTVLASASTSVEALIAEMREGLHHGAPLREQIPRIEALAEQYDLAGMHDAARDFRRKADALIPLRNMQDQQEADDAHRKQRRRKWFRPFWGV